MNDVNALYKVLHSLRFYASPEHPCSYIEENTATTLFVDPSIEISSTDYSVLSSIGFRRSGEHVYRPHCNTCYACIPVRIPVHEFIPNRSQQRCQKKSQGLQMNIFPANYYDDHFDLYRRYMQSRHAGGGMDNDDPAAYQRILESGWAETWLYELRDDDSLLAVAIVDQLDDGLSAVYTYFEPELKHHGLGTYMILQQIAQSKARGLDWVYLGYWNKQSQKMAYKINYRPIEVFDGHHWSRLEQAGTGQK